MFGIVELDVEHPSPLSSCCELLLESFDSSFGLPPSSMSDIQSFLGAVYLGNAAIADRGLDLAFRHSSSLVECGIFDIRYPRGLGGLASVLLRRHGRYGIIQQPIREGRPEAQEESNVWLKTPEKK